MKASSSNHFNLKKPTPVLADKELEALRVRTWFFHISNEAIGSQVDDFRKVLWEQVALGSTQAMPNLSLQMQKWLHEDAQTARLSEESLNFASNLRYVGFHTGKTSPANTTLSLFEELLPGSRAEYDFGPQGEPLWAIIAGKVSVCEQYIDECLKPKDGQADISFEERVQRIFDGLIAPAYGVRLNNIPHLGVVQEAAHPVWLTHVNEVMRVTYDDDEEPELLEAPSIDDQILLAIALWLVALDRNEGPILRLEWLLVGLCWGVIGHHFNDEIQAFVLKMLRERGSTNDADAKRRGLNQLDFEQRWTTEI